MDDNNTNSIYNNVTNEFRNNKAKNIVTIGAEVLILLLEALIKKKIFF